MHSEYTPAEIERFWSRINRDGPIPPHYPELGPCWLWTGYCGSHGYGRITLHSRDHLTHRLAYVLTFGPIPGGLWVLHHCDNPPCCNPAHFFTGTNRDNTADRHTKGRDASGERNGMRIHPEQASHGDQHWTIQYPENVLRGEHCPASRLSEDDVRTIRRRRTAGEHLAAIASDYGVTYQAIYAIVTRRNWKHVV